MYSSALSIEIISDVEFSRRLVESRSDKLKQVKSSKIKANAGEKQLNSSVGTKQLNSTGENNSTRQHERNNSTGENNSTQQQERKQLNSAAGTKQQLNETTQPVPNETPQPHATGTKQLNSVTQNAYNRLQPPTTAYISATACN
ncbi:hypothetical protein TNCV_2595891 [Trichonephila clavipes]|nr:hypothetical protein TNCV_2595891 [Trichonephila clavipes]